MRSISGGGDVHEYLRFPRWMGKVKEAWVLCGFEPVLTGDVWEEGCCNEKSKGDGRGAGKNSDDGKRRSKYFMDS
jgi:hypothetical protein